MRQPVSDGLASAVDTREECAGWRMDEAAEKGQADNSLNKELISSKPEWGEARISGSQRPCRVQSPKLNAEVWLH